MNKDIRGIINKYNRYLHQLSIMLISSLFCKVNAIQKGVLIGKSCKFYGITYFYRMVNTKIEIGNCCTFRSSSTSNLIGINRQCMISTLRKNAVIVIGNKCGFSGTVIGSFNSIMIGNNVRCGANTLITDSDWHLEDPNSSEPRPVSIGDNVWLGEGVKVLKGVNIGHNSIIGAGSIVVRSIPANVMAAGNPCEIIKQL